MALFEDFCNSEANQPKILKFEGNTPIIQQGGNYIFSSGEFSLRYWYKPVTSWTSVTNTILPGNTSLTEFNFNTIFALIIPPSISGISPVPVLSINLQLYEVGNITVTPDIIIPINDTVLLALSKEYEKIEVVNNSTGLVLPHKFSLLLTK